MRTKHRTKYLVIGDATNSMHVFNFVKTVLVPKDFEIHLFTLSAMKINPLFEKFYSENNIHLHSIYSPKRKGLLSKKYIYRIRNFILKFLLMIKLPRVDVCHIHSLYPTSILLAKIFSFKFKKIILSYWGGDIEDTRSSTINIRRKLFKKALVITIPTLRTKEQFIEIYGSNFVDKLFVCRFATIGIDLIKQKSHNFTISDCKKSLNIPVEKICITVGYSASRFQHQDQILSILNALPENIKQKIYVIVPMQYNRANNDVYINNVHKIAKKCTFDIKILEEFVPFERSILLPMSTDIYLHLLDTDAFSNSLKEQVFSSSVIIKGSWLIYRELDEMGAKVISIDSLESLPEAILSIIDRNYSREKVELFEPIYNLYCSSEVVKRWNEIINKATLQENDTNK